ncbi:MAG: ATP-dependent Clp protease ATP-binding subunit [Clostridia bacterium]|nr:ATP-dependent Clp protease ATP-binding subunit [Clostridia bacterium]
MAVVFVTKIVDNEAKSEGLCLFCAKKIGIPQVQEILDRMNITDDMLENIETDMDNGNVLQMLGVDDEAGDNAMNEIVGMMGKQQEPDGGDDENADDGDLPEKAGDGDNGAGNQKGGFDLSKLFAGLPFGMQKAADDPGQKKKTKSSDNGKKFLSQFCRNLTADAAEGKLDNVIGRERETVRLMQILTRRQKNNPCLIGEPGVGKTAIAESLAQKIAAGTVPYKLRDKEVWLVDMTSMVAGTQFRGQFESRMKGLINEVKALGNIILVIDEIHSIVGAGDAEGSMNAANILKPALSRGEIQVIGATTLTEYRKYIEKDAALERRFQPIIIEEPSIEQTKQILRGIKKYYEEYHRIHIGDDVIDRAVELSERYITDRFLPDKAIDLLDEASAHLAMESPVIERYEKAEKTLADIRARAQAAEDQAPAQDATEEQIGEHYRRIAELKASRLQSEEEYERLKKELATVELTADALADIIEIWTGVPAGSINANEYELLDGLASRLKARIIGQDTAVDSVVRAIKRNRSGVSYKKKPASFIFAGPTGVGKTELVKVLAEDLFKTPDSLIRLDMSEFMEKFSVSRIIGSPPGYVGYDDAGQLTEKIRRKPYSVVLFDEIEKAHPDVLNILLQILDDGRVTDSHGKVVNFSDCIIVMTTNAGSSTGMNTPGFGQTSTQIAEGRTEKALLEFLRPEFINRVDEVITFRSLDENDFVRIADIMLGDLKKALAEKGIAFKWTEAASKYIAAKSFSNKYGARNMRRFISREVEDVLAEKIIASYSDRVTMAAVDSDGESLTIIAK